MPSPLSIVNRLIENDLPDDSAYSSEVKSYIAAPPDTQAVEGIPVTGFYRSLAQKFEQARRNRDKIKVANNTWLVRDVWPRPHIAIRLHETDVVSVTEDDTITVDTGGWETKTTMARINDYLPGGWRIYSHKGTWYWWNYKTDNDRVANDTGIKKLQPFSAGDTISADGILTPKAPPELKRVRKTRSAI